MRSIRWGVLGVANIAARTVIPAIQGASNARLTAIASRTPARAEDAARRLGIPRAYGSYEALLGDPEVDAVYIPLPNSLHREWTIRCAEAGKHVLCEKPLALTAREAEEMAEACRERGVALMEAFMYRFHPRTERVGRMAADGMFGDVRMVRAAFTFAVREPDRNIRFRRDLGGGALYDVGCYTINVSRMILGEPEMAFAAGRIGDNGVDDQVGAILCFAGGRVALIDCGLLLPRREEYEVVGTAARLQVPNAFLPGTADAPIIITRGTESTTEMVAGTDQSRRMVERFGEAVAAGAPPPLAPADAAGTLKVIEALLASIRSGQPQPVR